MGGFEDAESIWAARLGNLRNVVRQHLITDQLGSHLDGIRTVLDIGCGQGTQALVLAGKGLDVTGLEPSAELLDLARIADKRSGTRTVRWILGSLDQLDDLLGGERFDLVCAHGLLTYLPDPLASLRLMSSHARPGGRVSFTVRNGDALAFRPGVRGQWTAAIAAFDSAGEYVNELGVRAAAHKLEDVLSWCETLQLDVLDWYGVRVFTDAAGAEATVADIDDLGECLAAEVVAGRTDPYRRLGSQLHVVAALPS